MQAVAVNLTARPALLDLRHVAMSRSFGSAAEVHATMMQVVEKVLTRGGEAELQATSGFGHMTMSADRPLLLSRTPSWRRWWTRLRHSAARRSCRRC